MVNLIYLDDTLQRIVVSYLGLSPDSSEVDNLNDLLVQRYCLLNLGDNGTLVHLNAAIKQAKEGNVGQSLQLNSTCKISPGDFFVQVQNNVGSSDVRIFLSSDFYGSCQQQNEFAEQWEDPRAIEQSAEPKTVALVRSPATSPPPQTSQLHADKAPTSHATAERHTNGSRREVDEHGNSWLCRDGHGCELETRAGVEPVPVPSPPRPVYRKEVPASDTDDWGEPLRRKAAPPTTDKTSSQPEQPKFVDPFE